MCAKPTTIKVQQWIQMIFFASFVVTSMPSYSTEILEAIPDKFQGYWASDTKHCNIDHSSNLKITSTSLYYWESVAEAISVVAHDNQKVALISEFSGEGDKWIGFVHFQISADGEILTDIRPLNPKDHMVRYRCS